MPFLVHYVAEVTAGTSGHERKEKNVLPEAAKDELLPKVFNRQKHHHNTARP
ncbi:MAG: hypothetical protein ACI8XG_002191 [Congregibacter sp.]